METPLRLCCGCEQEAKTFLLALSRLFPESVLLVGLWQCVLRYVPSLMLSIWRPSTATFRGGSLCLAAKRGAGLAVVLRGPSNGWFHLVQPNEGSVLQVWSRGETTALERSTEFDEGPATEPLPESYGQWSLKVEHSRILVGHNRISSQQVELLPSGEVIFRARTGTQLRFPNAGSAAAAAPEEA
eukprot:TRINITY_DN13262_c0_g1_i1.p3 TRINITY_DN13262_c0_g1~~TRINITY_DN13262_c0_g1_i1.p3  ORF type:complete len:200 (+),score=38.78 TRINITY_DN13262_c0_g1_i1:46-600(+)